MQFAALKLTGFKSFVDAVELAIEPGLTGIVGPNGCGKSNLVEALRWAMGETSARKVRGGEMDDVIFGGTSDRPARNIAEVTICLDNGARTAPAAFNAHDRIEVSRRIERERGSAYRINGQDVRGRDVQLVFADLATGARSSAIVSQGRIAEVINARPEARRLMLEEAAGITGLHSRRHEAELRLRAATANLERLDDVLATLDDRFQGLRRQARQARRYRNLGDHIRRAEALLLHLAWTSCRRDGEAAAEQFAQADSAVAAATAAVAAATSAREEAAQALPPLREAEAAAGAEVQRLGLAREGLDEEERRVGAARAACATQLAQIGEDIGREESLAQDAGEAAARLRDERAGLETAGTGAAGALEAAAGRRDAADADVGSREAGFARLTASIAADEAREAALAAECRDLAAWRDGLAARRDAAAAECAGIAAQQDAGSGDDAAVRALAEAEAAVDAARRAHDDADAARTAAEAAERAARDERQTAGDTLARLRAEEAALADLLRTADGDGAWTPVIESVAAAPGCEAALAAALGDDLEASEDRGAPRHWRTVAGGGGGGAPLPAGATPLAEMVEAPPALAARLAQIGLVDAADGERLAAGLAVGQRLVSRDGGLWRWDGFVVRPGAPGAAATRLRQRSRRAELWQELDAAETAAAAAEARLDAARAAADGARADERAARDALRAADAAAADRRRSSDARVREAAAAAARRDALAETLAQLDSDLADVAGRERAAAEARDALPDLAARRDEAARLGDGLAAARAEQADARAGHDVLVRQAGARRQRLDAVDAEIESWQRREAGAGDRIRALQERRSAAAAERGRLADEPARLAARRTQLLDLATDAERNRDRAADRLAAAETRDAGAARALKARDGELMAAREARVRAEGARAQAEQALEQTRRRIAERLDCEPGDALALAEPRDGAALPEEDATRTRLERLLRERDNMGPVNLCAEEEADALLAQISTMQDERADLTAAINRLRHGIGTLNREARERLLASFAQVDRHFRELFARLFGGGRAHLRFIDSDDPLEAGLEVFASPPGKRLRTLQALSGGETALAAVALLFAVFRTNPAPICVLDEVDAPLDEPNVEGVCALLEDMARSGGTRFLLVTHHRMTMARMDRLYGVTMPEPGVSRLVSVDLSEADELRQAEIA